MQAAAASRAIGASFHPNTMRGDFNVAAEPPTTPTLQSTRSDFVALINGRAGPDHLDGRRNRPFSSTRRRIR